MIYPLSAIGPLRPFRTVALLACAALGLPALGQNTGDAMQVYERTERQIEELNQIVQVAEITTVATVKAIRDFAAATAPETVEETKQKALGWFLINEESLENLSRLLQDLSNSLQDLTAIANSNAWVELTGDLTGDLIGFEYSGRLENSLVDADTELSKLSNEQSASLALCGSPWRKYLQHARLILTHLSMMAELLGTDAKGSANLHRIGATLTRLEPLQQSRADADTDLADTDQYLYDEGDIRLPHLAPSQRYVKGSLQRIGVILSRLSAMVEMVKIKNDFKRELVLALSQEEALRIVFSAIIATSSVPLAPRDSDVVE